MKVYLIHYGELALKGKNRKYFEHRLIDDINSRIKDITDARVERRYGKMILETDSDGVEEVLQKVPGIAYFAIAEKAQLDLDDIKAAASRVVDDTFETFKVETKRSNKLFPFISPQVSKEVGGHIVANHCKKVSLKEYDKLVNVEIGESEAIVYLNRVDGMGGLPKGVSGRVVGMLSGGIDSPVAMQLMMKRGCEVILMHAFNVTVSPEKVREKLYEISEELSKFQGSIKLYMIPYGEMLKEIVKNVPDAYRMIAFKRSVARMANMIARHVKAKAIINGDAVGQVASQTLENIQLTHEASRLPILSPLIAHDKQETIKIAHKIGTYELSIKPYEDCCSLISGKNPATKGKLHLIKEYEEKFDFESIEKQMIEESILKVF